MFSHVSHESREDHIDVLTELFANQLEAKNFLSLIDDAISEEADNSSGSGQLMPKSANNSQSKVDEHANPTKGAAPVTPITLPVPSSL